VDHRDLHSFPTRRSSDLIIFTFLIFSGLILWLPKKLRAWKQGFKIKLSANWKRINHDLHNTLGFYSFILLLVMSLTGLCWSFERSEEHTSELQSRENLVC